MPSWGWLLTAMLGALIVWMVPRVASFMAEAVNEELVDRLADRLEERLQQLWTDDMAEALQPIHQQVSEIRTEVMLNGGGSMKDLVQTTSRQVEWLITTAGGYRE